MSKHRDYAELAERLGIQGHVSGAQLFARCPLHRDSTPSFDLNVYSGLWTCHRGCGPETGRTFERLVMLVNDCGYLDALRWIEANGAEDTAPLDEIAERNRARLIPPSPAAEDAPLDVVGSGESIWRAATGETMPMWFLQRGFTWATIAAAEIRYLRHADCIVIPVLDWPARRMVGVVVRRKPSDPIKYWNSPALPKSKLLYGLAAVQGGAGRIIVTEGPLDALYISQCSGVPAVAAFGAYVSADQVDLLQRAGAREIVLAFDADAAGAEGARKAARKLLEGGYLLSNIRRVSYPSGRKDANECTEDEISNMVLERNLLKWLD